MPGRRFELHEAARLGLQLDRCAFFVSFRWAALRTFVEELIVFGAELAGELLGVLASGPPDHVFGLNLEFHRPLEGRADVVRGGRDPVTLELSRRFTGNNANRGQGIISITTLASTNPVCT